MIDELYVEEHFRKTLQKEENLCLYNRSKCCWISIIDAGQRTFDRVEELLQKMNTSKFKLQKLHVLYRSSAHIARISHSFIVSLSYMNETSAKELECFQSSQSLIEVFPFEDIEEVLASTAVFTKFNSDRIVILFTEHKTKYDPEEILEKLKEKHSKNGKTFKSVLGLWNEDQFHFTGIEAKSVLIVLDLNVIYQRSIYLINLAVNRAQCAVGVFIQKKLERNQVWVDYLQHRKPKHLEIYEDLLNGKLSEERNKDLKPRRLKEGDVDRLQDVFKNQLQDENVKNLIDTDSWKVCFQRVFLFDNIKLINEFIKKLGATFPFLPDQEGESLNSFLLSII